MSAITTEDLLLYLYQETSATETRKIEDAVRNDWELKEKLDVLKNSLFTLDQMLESPRPQAVSAILKYAQATAPIEHHL